jgi:hypothetical protein
MEEHMFRLMANPFKIQMGKAYNPLEDAPYRFKCLLQKYPIHDKYYPCLYSKIENILQDIQVKETLESILHIVCDESDDSQYNEGFVY